MDKSDIVIIGGGISGLSLAFYCARSGFRTLVLEKENRAGGCFHSHRIEDGDNRFWIELGAHTCYNSYRNLLDIIDECEIAGQMTGRARVPYRMYVDDRIQSVFSRINYPELLTSLPRLFFQEKTGHSVASYYSRVVGEQNYQNTFRHFFNAVPSQESGEFPADMLFKKRARRKDVLKSFTFTEGLQTITDVIAANKGIQVLTEKQADSVSLINDHYCVVTKDGSQYEARYLAMATPAHVSARLLQPVYPELAQQLFTILPARINTTGVILQEKSVTCKPVAGIVSPDDLFYSIVSRDTVPDRNYRGFTFHFKADVDDFVVRMKRIEEVLRVTSVQIEYGVSKLNLLPAPRLGHQQLVDRIDTLLENRRLLLTGNYFDGISIEDCVSRSLSEFSRLRLSDSEGTAGR